MNICKCFQCNTCGIKIDCRIGMSNRDIQPFQFACPKCEERISFVFGQLDGELLGATELEGFKGPFNGTNPFVDLHLDFPAYFGVYVKGRTTFLRVTQEIGHQSYQHLNLRLNMLNTLYPMQNDLRSVITQYKRGDIDNFEKTCAKIPEANLKSRKKEDVLTALYTATSVMSSPFTIHEHNSEISTKASELFMWLHQYQNEKTVAFIDEILGNGFLKNLHNDCLSLYPKLIAMDLPFRSAFFYDYANVENLGKIPARISTADFDVCSNYYKDLAEVFSRQLTFLAGLNNLIKRGDSDLFESSLKLTRAQKIRPELENLNSFSNVDLGSKLAFIDDCFYRIDMDAIDNKLRNGIAHYKYEYKESTQTITYYPGKEGMSRVKYYEISFMDFIRKSLLLFREVHGVNHIMKAALFYCVLILKKEI
ncbi:hypothetical protein [Pseudomonas protegens]|uniref:hypothetical protein n=1 Tax=Pseudomonas protegens TaxID=380021 RepID=UPI000642C492|nr:hypothetical protein [Pseudomonas protegens]